MYKRRRRRNIVVPLLAGVLTLATLGSTAVAAPLSVPQAAAYLGSLAGAPGAALAAARQVMDDAMGRDSVPAAASAAPDAGADAGFWTQAELPAQSADAPDSGSASSEPANEPVPEGMMPI